MPLWLCHVGCDLLSAEQGSLGSLGSFGLHRCLGAKAGGRGCVGLCQLCLPSLPGGTIADFCLLPTWWGSLY